MVKIVILTGSPHVKGTSLQLADSFEKGARESGHEVFRFDAGLQGSELKYLKIVDGEGGKLIAEKETDFFETQVIPKLLEADVVVLVSSIYYYGINAQLKVVIDRFYGYNHELKDKRKSVVLCSGYGPQEGFRATGIYFEEFLKYMRWPNIATLYADSSFDENKLKVFAEEAYKLGKSIQ